MLLYMAPAVFAEPRPGVGIGDEVVEPFGEGIGIPLADKEAGGDAGGSAICRRVSAGH